MDYYQKAICVHCQKEFDVYVYNLKKGFGKYCSKACSNKATNHGYKKGHPHYPWKGDKVEIGKKISSSKKGMVFTEKHRKAMSEAQVRRWDKIGRQSCRNEDGRRKCHECIKWRKAIFERDDYTCQICFVRGVYIEADHIKSWRNFPDLRHELSNGRTLCKPCHMKTDNYKSKARNENHG